jgi:uncharacterized protein YheU (UPF0270 family)
MIIPHDQLHPETLRALIEEFVSRDGAVHGHQDASMDERIENVLHQLVARKIVIVYDEEDESCSIVRSEDARRDEKTSTD